MKLDWNQIYKLYEDEWQEKASARWSKHVKLAEKEAERFIKRADIPNNLAYREAFIIGYRNGASGAHCEANEYIEKRLAALKRLTKYVLRKYEIIQAKEEKLKTIQRNTNYELNEIKKLRTELFKEEFLLRRLKKALKDDFNIKQV